MNAVTTRIVFDGHVHLYPGYDWNLALSNLFANLGTDGTALGLLAEASSCHFYRDVITNPASFRQGAMSIEPGPGPHALTVKREDCFLGWLIAGRQIVTQERLEVLALGTDADVANGQPLDATLEDVRRAGSVPVLSWSPGKWFFGRGTLVENLLRTRPAGSFMLGDTALRPSGWPMPGLLRLARERGFKVIGGSDALPLRHEERWLGRYGVSAMAPFDPLAPADSVYRMLSYGNTVFAPRGRRCTPLSFARRWIANSAGLSRLPV